ncbi:MAG TPA: lysylphosphatidylglycerol synthase transmembrane domain-containing protein [Bacteroidia bacterium]|nr:lysylphosphatidylglycerol synthase transmembrane domain-containing protein [Bacteroidia bacterium]
MKKQTNNILKFIFFLGLGVLLVWLSVKDISKEQQEKIKIALLQADYSFVALSILVGILSHYFRAIRWKILLVPLNHRPKTSNTFFAVMVGYLANLAINRLGEVTRCGMLNQYEKVPFTEGFGSVVAERALDLICLILIFFITLFIEFDKIYGIANDQIITPFFLKLKSLFEHKILLAIMVVMLLIIAAILFYFRKKLQEIFSAKIKNFIVGLWQGLISIKNVKQPISFIAYTILIWLMYILQAYVCFFAFPETAQLPFMAATVIMVFGSLGIIAVPGGTGAYQAIVMPILITVYLVPDTSAFAFAWTVWAAQIVLILTLGLISLILLPLLNKQEKILE